jgi:hypothetical protein
MLLQAAINGARPPAERRLALVRRWHVLPDFASVNFHEVGAVELAEELCA